MNIDISIYDTRHIGKSNCFSTLFFAATATMSYIEGIARLSFSIVSVKQSYS